jgi:hypothetical protein
MISEIQKDEATEQIKKTSKSKFKTIWEKMDHYETTADGKIKLPYVYEEDGKTQKIYETIKEYQEWKDKKVVELKEKIFEKLTPMEYYITQGKGTERPYTGEYWDTEKVGVYCCKVCTQRIFSSTHKYQAKGIGHATFWNFLPFTLNFYEDNLNFPQPTQAVYKLQFAKSNPKKRATCSNVYYFFMFSVMHILGMFSMMARLLSLRGLISILRLFSLLTLDGLSRQMRLKELENWLCLWKNKIDLKKKKLRYKV